MRENGAGAASISAKHSAFHPSGFHAIVGAEIPEQMSR
jgi:hypothetical protein